VAAEHELAVEAIVLIRQASLPRTTSGKLQRSLCRQRYLQNDLKIVAIWSAHHAAGANGAAAKLPSPRPGVPSPRGELAGGDATVPDVAPLSLEDRDRLVDRIETRLVQWIMQRCDLAVGEVDRHKPFAELGLDSLSAVELSAELEQWLQVQIPAVAAWNHPTPHAMARYLAQLAADASGGPAADALANRALASAPPSDSVAAQEFEDLLADIEGLSEADVQEALKASGFDESSAEPQTPG
jgi:acyl carrier protein